MATRILVDMNTSLALLSRVYASELVEDSIDLIGDDQVAIYISDDVNLGRQVEILNGLEWLYNGAQDRALFDVGFKGFPLYSAVSIDSISAENRRTGSDLSFLAITDIAIGVGANVTNFGGVEMIREAIYYLTQYARENLFVQPATIYVNPVPVIDIAAGTNLTPAVMSFSGSKLIQRGTVILIAGTTSAGPFGVNVPLPKDMTAPEFAAKLADYLKGWSQSTFTWSADAVDPTKFYISGIAAFGGTVITLDTFTLTAPA
jgi:hypothetical protein